MTPIFVAFGSNLGDRAGNISLAISSLEKVMIVESVSGIYETAPMYVKDQPPFLNGVVVGVTEFGPIRLVHELKLIEREIGRQERVPNGPREIDLDLITFGNLVFSSRSTVPISLPHPRLKERRFVLEPLCEVAPEAFLPRLGLVETLLQSSDVLKQDSRRVSDAGVSIPSHR